MIFSQWQPDGQFAYYESSKRHPIGDDVPAAKMPAPSGGIGVPAQDVGYPLPSDAVFIGYGDVPKGIMAPMARDGIQYLSGLGSSSVSKENWMVLFFLVAAFGLAAVANRGTHASR